MAGDPVLQLLSGQWPDPETGELLGVPVCAVVIAETLDGIAAHRESGLDRSLALAKNHCNCRSDFAALRIAARRSAKPVRTGRRHDRAFAR